MKEVQEIDHCPCCNSNNIRRDFDFPEDILCCYNCGADFYTDGEIILDPREIK